MLYRTVAAVAAAVITAIPAAADAQTQLKLLSSFDSRYPGYHSVVVKYTDSVKAASGGKITWHISGPEVVSPFEQFQPLTSGAFDVLFTVQPYHLGTMSVSMGLYALTVDPEGWRRNGVFDFVDKEYQRQGAKLLAVVSTTKPGVGAYQIMLKSELPASGDLKGLKVRGNPLYKAMIDSLGASMVTLAGGEVYSALQKGVVEGVFWPVIGAVDFKWYEVTKYMVRPTWGNSLHFLLANLEKFNKLAPAERDALVKEGAAIELSGMDAMDKRTADEIVELKKHGITEVQANAETFRKAVDIFTEGLWQQAIGAKATGERAKAFREFVTAKGIK
jgi:TRAP-type C4-dicarboxylate transport system substrate-binding protein